MEIQSGNGPEVSKEGGCAHSSPLALRPANAKEDLEENRRIEKFDIPLSSLKQMFEKPPAQHVVSLRAREKEWENENGKKTNWSLESVWWWREIMYALRCHFSDILLMAATWLKKESRWRKRRERGRETNYENSCCCMFKKSQSSIPKTFTSDFPSIPNRIWRFISLIFVEGLFVSHYHSLVFKFSLSLFFYFLF